MPSLRQQQAAGEQSVSELYHINSRLSRSDLGLSAWIATVNESPFLRHLITHDRSPRTAADRIALPVDAESGQIDLREAIYARRSRGEFGGGPLDLGTLSRLLALGAGISHERTAPDGARWSLRTAPSGGALYPIDLICLVHRVEGITAGSYLYEPRPHALLPLRSGHSFAELAAATYLDGLDAAAVAFVLLGVFGRSRFKCGERGYRFVLLEAGHIAQNLLLAAEAAQLSALPVGGFEDDSVNRLVHVGGVEEAAVYVVVMGERGESP